MSERRAINGVKWTAVENILSGILSIITVVVLSRLLSPQDFGLMALTIVMLGIAQIFIDAGVSNIIISDSEMSHEKLSTLYWINIILGFFVFIVMAVSAGYISIFYGESKLNYIVPFAGLSLIIQAFGQQYMAILRKQLRFDEVSITGMFSRVLAFLTALALAYQGYGVYSLVAGMLAGACVSSGLLIFYGRRYYRPSWHFRIKDAKEVASFGFYQMGEKSINYFNSNLDSLLIGKLFGADGLGIYSLSKQLIMKPMEIINPIVTRVAFPVMARLQHEGEALQSLYSRLTHSLNSINIPIYIYVSLFSKDITEIFLGEKWINAAVLIEILALYAACRSLINPTGSLLLAKGRADIGFWWNAALLLLAPLSVYLGSTHGLLGVAWALLLLYLLLIVPSWLFLVRPICAISLASFLRGIWLPSILALLSCTVAAIVASLFEGAFMRLSIGGGVMAILLACGYAVFNREFYKDIKKFI